MAFMMRSPQEFEFHQDLFGTEAGDVPWNGAGIVQEGGKKR